MILTDFLLETNTGIMTQMEETEGYDYNTSVLLIADQSSLIYKQLLNLSDWDCICLKDQGLWERFLGYQICTIQIKIIKYVCS